MLLMKIYTLLQKNRTNSSFSQQISWYILGTISLSLISIFLITEFFFIEPQLKKGLENQGQAMLEYFSQSTRNHLLSGYREGLYIASELLINTGQCDQVKIFDSQGKLSASFPTDILDSSYPKTTKTYHNILISYTKDHIHLTKTIYFDELTRHTLGHIEISISKQNLKKRISQARIVMILWLTLLMFCVALGVKKLIHQKITLPLKDLLRSLKTINQSSTKIKIDPSISKHKEFNDIYHETTKLIQKIQDAQDMLERKGATEAIGELMQDFSHGIRTPITVIKNRALDIIIESEKILELKNVTQKDTEYFRQKLLYQKEAVIDESNKLEGFVSRILDSTQPIDVRPTPTVLFNLAEKIIEIYRSQTFNKKIVFLNQINPKLPLLLLDKAYFEEVFDNLFSNSIYAIENNDHIEEGYIRVFSNIEGSNGSSRITISVEDNGCGIDDGDLKMIFRPHFTTKKRKGNGKGLYIVQRVLDKHHATITVESKLLKGTIMNIHFGNNHEV